MSQTIETRKIRAILPWNWPLRFRLRVSIVSLLMVYGFGILGMFTPYKPWFVSMTPVSLLLSYGLLWWNHPYGNAGSWIFGLLAFCIGYFAEVLGVNTGFPFGVYQYGQVLGPQLWNTPLIIGMNWTIVCYTSNELADRLAPQGTRVAWLLLGAALLCTLLDVLIEPVAIELGYWSWAQGMPPLQNYLGWFAVSWLIAVSYRNWMPTGMRNPLSMWLLGLQWIFFIILNM
ncbi:MAG: carotenoid biosynthesis protein [Saprospiraceae bacterium]|nr:carotenoid biosynthesis protein [Saprospiraceae bacterium]